MSLVDCHTVESELQFSDKMLPGIWDDYDPQTGFDEVSEDNMGNYDDRCGSYVAEITFDEPGLYKVLFNSYHRFSNKGHLTVEWKKPGGEREPIPSSAFGVRRQYGLPRAVIWKIIYNGDTPARPFKVLDPVFQLPMLARIEIYQCQPVILFAKAENMLGEEPVFLLEFRELKND